MVGAIFSALRRVDIPGWGGWRANPKDRVGCKDFRRCFGSGREGGAVPSSGGRRPPGWYLGPNSPQGQVLPQPPFLTPPSL